jgi:hypothetical protein
MILTIERNRGALKTFDVTRAVEGVFRVQDGARTVGYILEAGAVFVTLDGPVYNTSVEVGQSLDLESAVGILAAR